MAMRTTKSDCIKPHCTYPATTCIVSPGELHAITTYIDQINIPAIFTITVAIMNGNINLLNVKHVLQYKPATLSATITEIPVMPKSTG